jgi:multisubunit Na+/H+ antiporter MnhC subunit
MTSGGGIFSSASGAVTSAYNRGRNSVSSFAGRAAAARFMPRPPGFPGLPNVGAAQSAVTKLEKSSFFFKIVSFIVMTVFIGIFFAYMHKKESSFGADGLAQGLIITAIAIVGLVFSRFLKYDMFDYIISTQQNIICLFFLISYSGITSLFTPSGFIDHFLDIFIVFGQILADPTVIFDKGFSLIVPIIFFMIPLFILINNLTKNIWLALMVIASSAGVVYVLYPKNNVNPIPGGAAFDIGSSGCKENWYEIWKKSC